MSNEIRIWNFIDAIHHQILVVSMNRKKRSKDIDSDTNLPNEQVDDVEVAVRDNVLIMKMKWLDRTQVLATVWFDNTIRIWDPDFGPHLQYLDCNNVEEDNLHYSGRWTLTLRGHESSIESLVETTSSKSRRLISGSYDETVRIWCLESGCCIRVLRVFGPVWGVIDLDRDYEGGSEGLTMTSTESSTHLLMACSVGGLDNRIEIRRQFEFFIPLVLLESHKVDISGT